METTRLTKEKLATMVDAEGRLNLNGYTGSTLPSLPRELKILHLENCPLLRVVSSWQLPDTLEELVLSGCDSFYGLPDSLPVQRLTIEGCKSLNTVNVNALQGVTKLVVKDSPLAEFVRAQLDLILFLGGDRLQEIQLG